MFYDNFVKSDEGWAMDGRGRGLERIQRISRWAARAALVGMLGVVGIAGWLVVVDGPQLAAAISRDWLDGRALAPGVQTVVMGMIILALPLHLYGLLMARRLFAGYAAGEIFTRTAGRRMQRIGWAVTLMPPVGNLGLVLAHAAATWPPGWRSLAMFINLDPGDVLCLVFGPMLIVIGWVMGAAADIADENQSFI